MSDASFFSFTHSFVRSLACSGKISIIIMIGSTTEIFFLSVIFNKPSTKRLVIIKCNYIHLNETSWWHFIFLSQSLSLLSFCLSLSVSLLSLIDKLIKIPTFRVPYIIIEIIIQQIVSLFKIIIWIDFFLFYVVCFVCFVC